MVFLFAACFAAAVTGCNQPLEEQNDGDQIIEIEEIEAIEENLDEKTELLKEETESLEEDVDQLLEGI